jgi:hypothetical protein
MKTNPTSPQNKDDIKSIYNDGTYLKDNPGWHSEDSEWKSQQILNLLSNNIIKPSTVCDVGCGSGEIINQLSLTLRDTEFCGYETSQEAFELCKLKESKRVHFESGDILQKNVYYDLLLCLDVFEHVPDYMGFISGLKSKAKYKVFHIPLDISVSSILLSSMMNARKKVGHLHYFTPETAIASLEDCGYSVVDSFYTTKFSIPNKSHKLKTKIAKLPRKLLYLMSPDLMVKFFSGCSLIVLAE